MAAAPAAQWATVVVVHSAEALVEAVRSHMVEAHIVEALMEDMVVWEAVAKLRAPAHAPQHSSYAALRS